MTSFLAQIITWLNVPANALGRFLLAPLGVLPGWLSNTIASAVVGVVLLIIFKYTSNQRAVGRVRDNIKANMLALKLFKDDISVTFQAQGRLFAGAFLLLFHAVRPMLVMIVPVSLVLGQLGLWYQSRPLLQGEQAVVVMELNDGSSSFRPEVSVEPASSVEVVMGPVEVLSKRQIYWEVKAIQNGYHRIIFRVGQQRFEKELAIGDGFMRVSSERPGWHWADILTHPLERPFGPDSIVRSISIDYPQRLSRTSGTNWWLIYFFIASLVFALIFKPFFKVRI